nr:hypothetical protein [Tanacetum cinerariifolium]
MINNVVCKCKDNDVNVNENADKADNEEDADNDEEDDNNEEDADKNDEDDDNEDDAKNEDEADKQDDVDQVLSNIKKLPFFNAPKRSRKKEVGKGKEEGKKDKESRIFNFKIISEKQSKNDIEEDPQKKCLKDMGFERMIHFPIVEHPSTLAYHTIDHFHPGIMELRLEKGSIKETRQKVHDMLGMPIGTRKLEDLEHRPSNDPFIKEWEEQFKNVPKPTLAAIALVISDTTKVDFMFQMNFIALFGSTMGILDNGGRVSMKLLKRIGEDVDISDIDWCEYIIDCLYTTLRSWNTTTMKKRIKMKTETRCLGQLEHHGEFDREEEHDGMNVYKGLDVYVPPINDKEPKTKESTRRCLMMPNSISMSLLTIRIARVMLMEIMTKIKTIMVMEKIKSEGTKESGSEGTKEKESEGTEGESDGNEEKITEEDREVTVQMDVDNQNEELNKEKDANETEDNDKMNNNEMNNDLLQEKQDADKDENAEKEKVETEKEKQDKADKVENVQEKQDDDKDGDDEDEFWNTQFTDSQYEELENKAKEEIKKKKTTKRKSDMEITPPSFSFGLSPDTNKVEERA